MVIDGDENPLCADGVSIQGGAQAAVGCLATGRYVTLYRKIPTISTFFICSLSVFLENPPQDGFAPLSPPSPSSSPLAIAPQPAIMTSPPLVTPVSAPSPVPAPPVPVPEPALAPPLLSPPPPPLPPSGITPSTTALDATILLRLPASFLPLDETNRTAVTQALELLWVGYRGVAQITFVTESSTQGGDEVVGPIAAATPPPPPPSPPLFGIDESDVGHAVSNAALSPPNSFNRRLKQDLLVYLNPGMAPAPEEPDLSESTTAALFDENGDDELTADLAMLYLVGVNPGQAQQASDLVSDSIASGAASLVVQLTGALRCLVIGFH